MSVVKSVVKKDLCIGCGYCAFKAGCSTSFNNGGFLVPDAAANSLSAEDEAFVAAACPGKVADTVVSAEPSDGEKASDHLWGRHYRVVTAWSTDEETRFAGSSGGALTGIARWLVETKQVDGVLVTGYDKDYAIGTESEVSASKATLMAGAGSKYCPASPLTALAELNEREGKFAVIARPCDIATLRRAMNAGDPIKDKIALLMSFFCAGTPSDQGNRDLLKSLGVDGPEQVEKFRHRGNGWPGDTRADLTDGEVRTCTYNESWGKILRRHVHTLCKICPDGIGEQADIVAADAWYGDDEGYPTFGEAAGRSLVIARTPLGQQMFDSAVAQGALESEPLDIREIDRMQPGQLNRRRQLAMRVLAYRMVGHAVPKYNSTALKGYQVGMNLKVRIRVLLATLRRLVVIKLRARKVGRS